MVIEPYVTEKQCRRCNECKPLTSFSPCPNGSHGRHSYCKRCRSDYTNKANKLRTRRKAPMRAEAWPREVRERVLDRESVSWFVPVTTGPLVPALGMPVVGMREAA